VSLPLVLRPAARTDLLEARDWYEQQRPGLGDAFVDAVEQMFERIEAMPGLYAAGFKGVRCGMVRKYPYVVYYRILTNQIEVLAVLHGRRDPQVWRGRA
jgi:plasmid stabilization system protein ParE